MNRPLIVTARLSSPLAGVAPQLDALLESVLCRHTAKDADGYKIDRAGPAPPQRKIPIPVQWRQLGPWLVGRCSDPILAVPAHETVSHIVKKIAVEHASMLGPSSRVVVATTNSWTKSYRLPLRERLVGCVKWFAFGDRREILNVVRRVRSIGRKVSIGLGMVAEWTVETCEDDYSWYAPTGRGPMLMRTLPVGDWLPSGLIGARMDFGAAVPPYWHPERYTEIVVPC